ncbi:hypothetical protein LCGC14_2306250 [marine sediment metagenome]|uniref:Collagen-like protein n=1 Tax=marine sediment metagenome TaxID=412755 RepID=A0A0F9FGY9_9ZZZZ
MNRKIWSILVAVIMLAGLLAIAGCTGDDGAVGPAGTDGADGLRGEQGAPGASGIKGEQGARGVAGVDGTDGASGVDGIDGLDGSDGRDGAVGPTGAPGSGSRGATGATGASGPQYFTVTLGTKNSAAAVKTTGNTVQLTTTGAVVSGDEGQIIITPTTPMTLGQLDSISWWANLIAGYPPHVDVIVELIGGGQEALTFEYARNGHGGDVQPTYGAVTGAWYPTFNDDGAGINAVTTNSIAIIYNSGMAYPLGTLLDWQAGTVHASVDATSRIVRIDLEVDNWMAQTDALVDGIILNGIPLRVP